MTVKNHKLFSQKRTPSKRERERERDHTCLNALKGKKNFQKGQKIKIEKFSNHDWEKR